MNLQRAKSIALNKNQPWGEQTEQNLVRKLVITAQTYKPHKWSYALACFVLLWHNCWSWVLERGFWRFRYRLRQPHLWGPQAMPHKVDDMTVEVICERERGHRATQEARDGTSPGLTLQEQSTMAARNYSKAQHQPLLVQHSTAHARPRRPCLRFNTRAATLGTELPTPNLLGKPHPNHSVWATTLCNTVM